MEGERDPSTSYRKPIRARRSPPCGRHNYEDVSDLCENSLEKANLIKLPKWEDVQKGNYTVKEKKKKEKGESSKLKGEESEVVALTEEKEV